MHSFECEEYLIAPSDIGKARSVHMYECTIYNIKDVAQSVLTKGKVRDDSDTKKLGVEQIVGAHDPFLCIAPSVTRALFNIKLPLQDHHFQHIVERSPTFSFPLSHMSVKEHCSQLIVFAGRNPFVSILYFEHTISLLPCTIILVPHFLQHHILHFVLILHCLSSIN